MSNYVLVVYRHAVATIVIAPFALIFDKYFSLFHSVSLVGTFYQTLYMHAWSDPLRLFFFSQEGQTKDDNSNLRQVNDPQLARVLPWIPLSPCKSFKNITFKISPFWQACDWSELIFLGNEVHNSNFCSCHVQYSPCHHLCNGLDPQVIKISTTKPYNPNPISVIEVPHTFFRLEKVKIKSIRSQAKLVGTIATVGGAMIMTLIKGPILELFWVKQRADHAQQRSDISLQHTIKGSIMITIGCFSWACFMILQVPFSPHKIPESII